MDIKQTSLNQTGVAIIEDSGRRLTIPLFSLCPIEEAEWLVSNTFENGKVYAVFIANNLLDYKIENAIQDFQKDYPEVLPQNLMDELVTGFPFIQGFKQDPTFFCYG